MTNPFEIPLTDEQESEPVKHTPGPWKVTRWGQTLSIDGNEMLGIAHVNPTANYTAGIPSEQNIQNARLIAAAPSLLDELRRMKIELAHLYHNGQIKANAPERARIEKYITDAEYLIEKIEEG